MSWKRVFAVGISLILFTLILPGQADEPLKESGTWRLQVGVTKQPYQLQLVVHPFPSEIAPVSGTLIDQQGKKFILKKCSDQALGAPPHHNILYQPFNTKYGADCSWLEGIAMGEMGQPGCCKSLLILREGESVWMAEIVDRKTLKNGKVYHVPSGKLQAEFSGYKK